MGQKVFFLNLIIYTRIETLTMKMDLLGKLTMKSIHTNIWNLHQHNV
jgi:hypothetical protein